MSKDYEGLPFDEGDNDVVENSLEDNEDNEDNGLNYKKEHIKRQIQHGRNNKQ